MTDSEERASIKADSGWANRWRDKTLPNVCQSAQEYGRRRHLLEIQDDDFVFALL